METFAFGGVGFEVLSARGAPRHVFELLDDECRRYVPRFDDVDRTVAVATCSIGFAVCLPATGVQNEIRWRRDARDRALVLEGPGLHAHLRKVGHHRYAVSACLEPTPSGARAFIRAVSGALLHLEGGGTFHAVIAEHLGRAVLLMGPSGAGKSTAMSLLAGARCAAFDHAAVAPVSEGWVAWGLPGGRPADAARSQAVCLPLAGALRIEHGAGAPEIVDIAGVHAVFAFREALETGDFSRDAEDVSLRTAMALAAAIPVGVGRTVLGTCWDAELRQWLARRAG